MTVLKVLILLLLCVLAVSVSCSNSTDARVSSEPSPNASPSPNATPTPDKPLQAKQIEKVWSTKFEFATQSINRTHRGIRSYEISADYPQIKEQTPRTMKFNRWIRSRVRGYVHEFKGLEQNAEAKDKKRKLEPAHITEALKIWFIVYYADEHLLSLRLTHSVMALGQMHPIDYYETINYDLRLGRTLTQNDIFRNGYLKVFSQYSRTFVRENYEMTGTTDEWLTEGTRAKHSNFPNWNIVPDGILIAFEDYQIASHSFGQLELIIPYSELRTVLKPNAVTGKFGVPIKGKPHLELWQPTLRLMTFEATMIRARIIHKTRGYSGLSRR